MSWRNEHMDLSVHRQQVARSLGILDAAIACLVEALAHETVTADIEPSDEQSPIRRACEAYSAIDYRMDDEVGTSVVCLGVIGASSEPGQYEADPGPLAGHSAIADVDQDRYRHRIRHPGQARRLSAAKRTRSSAARARQARADAVHAGL